MILSLRMKNTHIFYISLYNWKKVKIGQQLDYYSTFISVKLVRRVRGYRNPYYDTTIPLKGIFTAKKLAEYSIQIYFDLSGYSHGYFEFKGAKKFNLKLVQ